MNEIIRNIVHVLIDIIILALAKTIWPLSGIKLSFTFGDVAIIYLAIVLASNRINKIN